jgi:hypothetical protein
LPNTLRTVFLKSHWQGPKSIKNISKSFNSEELIIKGPSKSNTLLYDKVEFLFRKIGGNWHLEIEELLPRKGISFDISTVIRGKKVNYFTRYIHAVTSQDLKTCFHLDGAIRVYHNFNNFKKRNLSDLKSGDWSKISDKYKLFKLDSEKGIVKFEEIIGLFFLYNPYVREFFEGENKELREMEDQRTLLFEVDFKYKNIK